MKVKYPRLWKHKDTGKELRVMPWWETVKDGEVEEVNELGHMIAEVAGRPIKFGVLTQVGYLLENKHGVWLGVGPRATESFVDIGEAPAKEKPK
jgi:hypothetical protein